MKLLRVILPIFLAMALIGATPITAHHSPSGEYDLITPTHIQGTVATVKWGNPHIQITIRGKDRKGEIVELRVEASSPQVLSLLGWTKETLTPGMNVRIGGYPAKNHQYSDFLSTTVTIVSTQRVLKAPPCWLAAKTLTMAEVENLIARCPIAEVP